MHQSALVCTHQPQKLRDRVANAIPQDPANAIAQNPVNEITRDPANEITHRINACAQNGYDLTVDAHAAITNESLGLTARGHTGGGQDFLKAFAVRFVNGIYG